MALSLSDLQPQVPPALHNLPYKLEVKEPVSRQDAAEFFSSNREQILKLVSEKGAILIRGLGQYDVEANHSLLKALGLEDVINYKGGGSVDRSSVSKDINTVTPFPKWWPITLHNELAYTDQFPRYMCFFCKTPAAEGGATSLGDGAKIYKLMPENVIENLETKGVMYKRFMYNTEQKVKAGFRKSWQETFLTEDKKQVEQELEKTGTEYEWKSDGLYTRLKRPAFHTHPLTGEPVWFNHIQTFERPRPLVRLASKGMFKFRDVGACYGDGSKIPLSDIRKIHQVLRDNTINEPWQPDEILLVDNIACMHGRAAFKGEREVTVGMFSPQS